MTTDDVTNRPSSSAYESPITAPDWLVEWFVPRIPLGIWTVVSTHAIAC